MRATNELPAAKGRAQQANGRENRRAVPRRTHGEWLAPEDRPDPIALLRAQDANRLGDHLPIRWGRMALSPFAFHRDSAALMAADLARMPRTALHTQLCGDAHLGNFGLCASPERTLVFDINDFEETLPGPFEWDVKRLATSFVVAARNNGFSADIGRDAAFTAARSYRRHIAAYAEMPELDVWYSRVLADDLLHAVKTAAATKVGTRRAAVQAAKHGSTKARTRTRIQAAGRLTEVTDGVSRFIERPPLVSHTECLDDQRLVHALYGGYLGSLGSDQRALLQRFDLTDVARKSIDVGSVGTQCFVVLLTGRDADDSLVLQVKEAGKSILEPYLGSSRYRHGGRRVVEGQRLMQAAGDIFLGWMTEQPAGRHYYWRQLRDMKGAIDTEKLRPAGLSVYAEVCGWALAGGHARAGNRLAISGYLGRGDVFDHAIADFAEAYADQTERDYEALLAAVKRGDVPATSTV